MVCVSHKQLIMRRFSNGISVYEALLMGRDENDADAWCKAMHTRLELAGQGARSDDAAQPLARKFAERNLRSLPEICADQLRVHHRANHHGPPCKFRISWSSTSAKANFCGGNVLTVTHTGMRAAQAAWATTRAALTQHPLPRKTRVRRYVCLVSRGQVLSDAWKLRRQAIRDLVDWFGVRGHR